MARYANPDVLDGSLNIVKTNCDSLVLVSAYTFGDSYATVTSNILASSSMSSTDFTLSTSGNDRLLTSASKSVTVSANGGGAGNHWVFRDTINSKVLWATPEGSGQSFTSGNPVTFPAIVLTSSQPTA